MAKPAKRRNASIKSKPTPEQVITLGPIAARLRAVMAQNDWGVPDFNEAIGKKRGNAVTYRWVRGTQAPSQIQRELISRKLGIPIADLTPRGETVFAAPMRAAGGIAKAVVRDDMLSYRMNGDGQARIQLDVTLPVEAAMALMHVLMERVPSGSNKDQ